MSAPISITHYSDPGCPWAYSAWPALALLHWRYGDGLRWRLVTIGLSEDARRYDELGYTPARMARGYRRFNDYGMPFARAPRERMAATGLACRAIVAVRLSRPELEVDALRALQFGQFTTTNLHDTDEGLRASLERVPTLDVDAILQAIHSPAVEDAYQSDRAQARTAGGGPTEFQGKAATSDGLVRFTAPSLVFEHADGRRLEAGGFQPIEAYDVVIANLDTSLPRRAPAQDVLDVLRVLPFVPSTREVAVCLAEHLGRPDDEQAEGVLIDATAEGLVSREGLGDGALWHLTAAGAARGASATAQGASRSTTHAAPASR